MTAYTHTVECQHRSVKTIPLKHKQTKYVSKNYIALSRQVWPVTIINDLELDRSNTTSPDKKKTLKQMIYVARMHFMAASQHLTSKRTVQSIFISSTMPVHHFSIINGGYKKKKQEKLRINVKKKIHHFRKSRQYITYDPDTQSVFRNQAI